jgi:hypothetical protein
MVDMGLNILAPELLVQTRRFLDFSGMGLNILPPELRRTLIKHFSAESNRKRFSQIFRDKRLNLYNVKSVGLTL